MSELIISIKGSAKDIAALVVALQEQPNVEMALDGQLIKNHLQPTIDSHNPQSNCDNHPKER